MAETSVNEFDEIAEYLRRESIKHKMGLREYLLASANAFDEKSRAPKPTKNLDYVLFTTHGVISGVDENKAFVKVESSPHFIPECSIYFPKMDWGNADFKGISTFVTRKIGNHMGSKVRIEVHLINDNDKMEPNG